MGDMAQLVARQIPNLTVGSSILSVLKQLFLYDIVL